MSAALDLLESVGLDGLTLRAIAAELHVQAPTLYYHFASKQDLVDEMASTVLARAGPRLLPRVSSQKWQFWLRNYASGFRSTLLSHRDGGRMIAGSRLTEFGYFEAMEPTLQRLVDARFSLREAVTALNALVSLTIGLVIEEQAVEPRVGARDPFYDLATRRKRIDVARFPLSEAGGAITLQKFERRFNDSVMILLAGMESVLSAKIRS